VLKTNDLPQKSEEKIIHKIGKKEGGKTTPSLYGDLLGWARGRAPAVGAEKTNMGLDKREGKKEQKDRSSCVQLTPQIGNGVIV